MIVETESHITQKEYSQAALKISYSKPAMKLLLSIGIICLILLLLQWFRVVHIFHEDFSYFPIFFIVLNLLLPVMGYSSAQRLFASSKILSKSVRYVFDEEKIAYFAEGSEGFLNWENIIKYKTVNNFLVLFVSDRSGYFIKKDKLTEETLNFIKSKIKTPED